MTDFIFKSTGIYLGFILEDGYIFSRDGIYLGWTEENNYVWDSNGQFRGIIEKINGNNYILRNTYTVPPVPRSPRVAPPSPSVPSPLANISPIALPIGYKDAF